MNNTFLSASILLIMVSSAYAENATISGGGESMSRPSAQPLPPLNYPPTEPPQGFTLPPVPKMSPVPKGNGRTVFIQRVILEGNTVFSAQELRAVVEPYENRALSVSDLEELRRELTRYYIAHGYVSSGALIPKDGLKNNELHVQIVEGRIDDVRIKGSDRLREGYIANRLIPNSEQPLNLEQLQDRFQLLLSDPLIERMNGRILPSTTLGHSILDVEVLRAQPYHLSVFGNNYRPPSIGGEAFGVNGSLSNLTGLGDNLDFSFTISDGSEHYSGGFNLPLSDYGTLAFFHFDEGDSMIVEQPVSTVDITSKVHSVEGGLSQLFIDTLRQRLATGVMLAIRQNETYLLDKPFSFIKNPTGSDSQATVLRFFQDYLQRWDNHALALRSTFSVGMNALGATPEIVKQYEDGEFFAWLGQGQYAYRVDDSGNQLVLRGLAQFSNDPLLPLERIAVGGVTTVRGYRENSLVRDQGYSLSAEYHYPLIGGGDTQAKHSLTLIPFLDWGQAWDHYSAEGTATLYSIGIGLNWRYQQVYSDFYYGHALKKPPVQTTGDVQDDGIHFQMRVDLL